MIFAEHPGQCELCGGNRSIVLFKGSFTLLLCRYCGLVYVKSDSRDLESFYANDYNFDSELDDRGRRHFFEGDSEYNKQIVEWVITRTEGFSLLEIGCNAGFLLERFKKNGYDTKGIDLGKSAVAAARSRDIDVIEGMIESTSFEKTFDSVLLIQTLEHIRHPLRTLKKIRSLVDGKLFIEVPDLEASNGVFRFKSKKQLYPSPNHLFIFTKKTITGILHRAGFVVEELNSVTGNLRIVARPSKTRNLIKGDSAFRVYLKVQLIRLMIFLGLKNDLIDG
ncbi:MAG: class I SAM-dependent methyltransferase [Nanobdellota archaeon]